MTVAASESLASAAEALCAGAVVAYPTESCFGLGCDPGNVAAIRRILAMKQRERDKGLILVADRVERLLPWLQPLPPEMLERVIKTWPGPVTWLCPAAPTVSRWLRGDHPNLAVRVTAHPTAAGLSRAAEMAVVSTSANRAGEPSLVSASDVERVFGSLVDVIVDAPIGSDPRPSTIIDATSGEILRS